MVPTLHVLSAPETLYPRSMDPAVNLTVDARAALLQYLSKAFAPPDEVAATVLLLLLISLPAVRPMALPPLGTLSVGFQGISSGSKATLIKILSSVWPTVIRLPLSIDFLHQRKFAPTSSDSSSLDAGVLQLADDTVLVIEEDAMGQGGQLNETAVKNLQCLSNCITKQTLRYDYPYMDSLELDCSLKTIVLSEAKSLLPVSSLLAGFMG